MSRWRGARLILANEQGQGMVEFALIAFVLVALLLGILDLGRGLYTYSVVGNAAREGARFAITSPSDTTGITARARDYAVGLDASALNVSVTTAGSIVAGEPITVTVSYDFESVTPLLSEMWGGGPIPMTARAVMNIE